MTIQTRGLLASFTAKLEQIMKVADRGWFSAAFGRNSAQRLQAERAVAVAAFRDAVNARDTRRQRAAYVEAVAATAAALRAEMR